MRPGRGQDQVIHEPLALIFRFQYNPPQAVDLVGWKGNLCFRLAGAGGIHRLAWDCLTWPLAKASADAELVGYTIVTKKMVKLGGASIQDIETWDDRDEEVATKVYGAAKGRSPLTGLGADPAQLIAGTTMALAENHTLYDELNDLLGKALDECYANDKVFKGWQP